MANEPKMPRMLEGYRVLDFTQFVAGPTCTRLLAEMGAEVIKLELAPDGDRVRAGGLKPQDPELKNTTHSSYYLQHNHSTGVPALLDRREELRRPTGALACRTACFPPRSPWTTPRGHVR